MEDASETSEGTSTTSITSTTWSADSFRREGASGSESEAELQTMRLWLMHRPLPPQLAPLRPPPERRVRQRQMGWGSGEMWGAYLRRWIYEPLAAPAA